MHTSRKSRRAISEVLATVILIAITLVAGVAVAGFAFGLFGTLGTTANISVTSAACQATAQAGTGSSTVEVTVTNSGGSAGTVTAISPGFILVGYKVGAGSYTAGTTVSVAANTASETLYATGTISAGQTITGNIIVNGQAPVPFTATCGS